MDMRPIGILGGTFNPVHHGHLRVALEARAALDLSAVHLIPLFAPPHRDPPAVSARLRLRMLQAAVQGEATLIADDREIRRGGISYTVDTLNELRSEVASTPLCLIVGTDAFAHLHSWHQWQRLIELAHIIVVHRPGTELPEHALASELLTACMTEQVSDLHRSPAGCCMSISIPMLDISSTQIRSILHNMGNPRYLLPDPVLNIIRAEKLYL